MKFAHSKIAVSLAAFSLFFLASCDALETSEEEGSASIADMPDFGDVEVEQVEVEGVGPTRDAAILNGLNLAVRQVTGVPLQGMAINSNGSLSYGQEGPQDFGITNETVLSISQGSVRSFKLLSDERIDGTTENVDRGIAASSASWRVVLSVEVNKYKASEKASLPKVVVADPRTNASRYTVGDTTLGASDASAQIKSIVGEAITKSNRFLVIDRTYDADIEAELAKIAPGSANPQEFTKLGQRLTADILVLPEIKRLSYIKSSRNLRFSGRELRSYNGGVEISFRAINVATGELIMAKDFALDLPSTPPTVYGQQRVGLSNIRGHLAAMSADFAHEFITKNFPIAVVKVSGQSLVLNQGASMLKENTLYELVKMGQPIVDPQSGQTLGRMESPLGHVRITKAMDNMSFGLLVSGKIDPAKFKPGTIELRKEVEQDPKSVEEKPTEAVRSATSPTRLQRKAADQRSESDIFDAEFD